MLNFLGVSIFISNLILKQVHFPAATFGGTQGTHQPWREVPRRWPDIWKKTSHISSRWWFQIFFYFHSENWGRFPFWLIIGLKPPSHSYHAFSIENIKQMTSDDDLWIVPTNESTPKTRLNVTWVSWWFLFMTFLTLLKTDISPKQRVVGKFYPFLFGIVCLFFRGQTMWALGRVIFRSFRSLMK